MRRLNTGSASIALIGAIVVLLVLFVGSAVFWVQKIFVADRYALTQITDEEEVDRLNPPTQISTEDDTTQAVPAPGFEDVPEMVVNGGENVAEPEPKPESPPPQREDSSEPKESPTPPVEVVKIVEWRNRQNGWEPSTTPPACPEPLILMTPTDLTLVTSVLYPGQYRGGDYKPHGGFRYDNSQSNEITIIAPMAARVVDGNRLLANGEIQYMFDFIAPCGIWYRFGHLRELSPKFRAIAETLPEAVEGNSGTHELKTIVTVTSGEIIATAVGLAEENNVFMDWGVYDLRSKNRASEDTSWTTQHPGQQEQNGVCWFDFLSPENEEIVRSLPPADGVSKATSDYCL